MKISFYLDDDGYINAIVDGDEIELCGLDTICEFPEDALETMNERLQQFLNKETPNAERY